jgi:hypothetical protein
MLVLTVDDIVIGEPVWLGRAGPRLPPANRRAAESTETAETVSLGSADSAARSSGVAA